MRADAHTKGFSNLKARKEKYLSERLPFRQFRKLLHLIFIEVRQFGFALPHGIEHFLEIVVAFVPRAQVLSRRAMKRCQRDVHKVIL
jgi:hypothetical protein